MFRRRLDQVEVRQLENTLGFRHDGSAGGLVLPDYRPYRRATLVQFSGYSGASPYQIGVRRLDLLFPVLLGVIPKSSA
jgi:hypothetical protein